MLSRRLSRLSRVLAGGGLAVALAVGPAARLGRPSDSIRDQQQWVLDMLNVQPAWSLSEGDHVTVAVIDSGVYPNVSDLGGAVITGNDFTDLNTPRSNPNWGQHGTWMASIIAGHGDGFADESGIIGVAPGARILSIRVIPDTSDPGYKKYDAEPEQKIQDELADGIREAVRDHAQVISMSIGYSAASGAVRSALQYAYSRGIVLVASSGNSGDNDEQHVHTGDHGWAPVSFPAEYPGVLGVGAVTIDRQPTSFSSGNLSVQVAAPGSRCPPRAGTACTTRSAAPARRARWWRAWPR